MFDNGKSGIKMGPPHEENRYKITYKKTFQSSDILYYFLNVAAPF